jgi:hypothetical protein
MVLKELYRVDEEAQKNFLKEVLLLDLKVKIGSQLNQNIL